MDDELPRGKPVFLFDLDGTVTTQETLPLIASNFGIGATIEALTQETVKGNIPFVESFIRRVNILKAIPVSEIAQLLEHVELSSRLVDFISAHSDDCFIVTGNLSCWIDRVMARIPCRYFASKGEVTHDRLNKITTILKKEDIVRQFKTEGRYVVFIGDGNNDSQAMREADLSIACGHTHWPAQSVLMSSDYAVFDEAALVRLLTHIVAPYQPGHSLVLSCAGIGSRLGINQAKSLIVLNGKPLIAYQMKQFSAIIDVRIVVGFQAFDVIKTVLMLRRDVIFVFNHDYFHTGTGMSFYLGSRYSHEFAIAWDGDLLVHPDDVAACLHPTGEYVGCSALISDQPVYIAWNEEGWVNGFSTELGEREWSGPACLRSEKLQPAPAHVYHLILERLPLPALDIRAADIDTHQDYLRACHLIEEWGFSDAE